jgi:hypothetical protein
LFTRPGASSLILGVLLAAGLASVDAQVLTSPEIRINSFEDGDQRVPLVATDGDGDAVVIWQSRNQEAAGWAIYAQRLDADLALQGEEFLVNDYNIGSQDGQSVVMAADGRFAVAWNGQDPDSQSDVVSVRRFAPDGTPLAGDRRISETNGNIQLLPRLGLTDDDELLISWEEDSPTVGFEILSRRANDTGRPTSAISTLNLSSAGAQRRGDLAVAGDGSVIAVWQDAVLDGSDWGIFLRCLDPRGQGPAESQVNQTILGQQSRPRVARAADGRFAVVWQDTLGRSSFEYRRIMVRLFGADCQALGPERQVNQFDEGIQDQPAIAVDRAGNYILAWQSFPDDFENQGIYARRLGRDGVFLSEEFRVNVELEAFQDFPSVSAMPDEGYLFVWESAGQDASGFGIFARRFAGPLAAELRVVAGADQAADIGQAYAQALIIDVVDQWGQPRIGEPVRVRAPAASAGVVFANGLNEFTAETDAQGRVEFSLTANGRPGRFEVLIDAPDSGQEVSIELENLAIPGAALIPVPATSPAFLLALVLIIAVLARGRLC